MVIKRGKIINKKIRSFEISVDSSKDFEVAIRKPRRKLQHHITWAKGEIYQFYIMFLTHHGKPENNRDILLYFFLMATITTMDFVLLVTFNFHIYHPIDPNWNNFGWAYEWLPPMLWI